MNPVLEEDEEYDNDDRYNRPLLRKVSADKKRDKSTVIDFSNNDGPDDTSIQRVYLEEEDLNILLVGYKFNRYRLYIYYILCVLTGGIFYLIGRWIPKLWVWSVGNVCELGKAEWVVVKNQWGDVSIEHVIRKYYGGTISSVFPVDHPEDNNVSRLASYRTDDILHNLHFFDHRYIRFIYNPILGKFVQNNFWKDPTWVSVKMLKKGVNRETRNEREIIFGQNLIDIQEKSTAQLLIEEALHPFYIFQIFSIVLWCLDEYYYYATCIFIISVTSIITTLIDIKQTMKKLREMSKFICNVRIFRGNLWRYVSSEELVPGDVFEISDKHLHIFPCDAVLLSGDCIVNESMLTGESIPVSKLPIDDTSLHILDLTTTNVRPEVAKHFLFSGTKIVRVRRAKSGITSSSADVGNTSDDDGALAMVVRTGFNTTKGSLIRSMLFPKPHKFKFYRDSFRFIGVLAIIAAIGFLISTYNFIRLGVNAVIIILRALDLITIVVPPALPATMTIGTNFAIGRLKKEGIFCISPTRVNVGGKLNVMCFDKTGTLTEDGLDVLGVRFINQTSSRFTELHTTVDTLSKSDSNTNNYSIPPILCAMTTCHSLKLVNGELIGDPLDLKMFDFTKWILEESGQGVSSGALDLPASSTHSGRPSSPTGAGGIVPTVVRPPNSRQFDLAEVFDADGKNGDGKPTPFIELGIIRTFEFVSSLRRMSVLVKRLRNQTIEVYVKGAPEVMRDICRADSFPEDYDELLHYYTHNGFRVIACASRSFTDLSWMKAQKIKREQIEQDLEFIGIIIFENKLKPGTASVVETLKRAKIRQIMCTGDNVLTAISVSRECGLINKASKVYVPRFAQGSSLSSRASILWESLDNPKDSLDSTTLKDFPSEYPFIGPYEYDLAVTGDVFRWIIDYGDEMTLYRMLVKGQIFARMSPDEKHELVEKLQEIGYCVGFCGDGANDCGALKAADVGLSLSDAEASVAAPFTSRNMDISCVIEVIKEGRAALVTSFSCFKYMALYSIIQFTTVSILYYYGSNLGNLQFLYIDLFLILPIAVLMGRTEPFPRIHPKRPTASLVSKKVLTPVIGQILIQSGIQFLVLIIIHNQPWYRKPTFNPNETDIKNFDNSMLFLLSCFQYIIIAAVFSVGPPYRKSMFTNVPFIITAAFFTLLNAVILISPSNVVVNLLELENIDYLFRWYLLAIVIADFLISFFMEKYVFDVISRWIGTVIDGSTKSDKKMFKKILAEMDAKEP
ncbi:P-type ATPase-like protein [Gigaspora margarita]|uniref:Cation-transporting ATPase n=2 Tax=Gigaspora margarita TaxID=4874 RepID=A0A8H3XFS5_GIGMA|nr:P-type ATPase-like protein [Gigaspora margarita]